MFLSLLSVARKGGGWVNFGRKGKEKQNYGEKEDKGVVQNNCWCRFILTRHYCGACEWFTRISRFVVGTRMRAQVRGGEGR